MPRKPIIRSNEHYYHITGRANNKEHFYLPTDVVWGIMLKKLKKLQKENDLKKKSLYAKRKFSKNSKTKLTNLDSS
jgi:hypothetical protein